MTNSYCSPNSFTVGVLNAVLSVSALAGVLCPPRWACLRACLPICLPPGFVRLGWGAVSASLGLSPGLSPNLSPTWLCLSPWAGVLCPPRSACLPICLPSGFVFHLGWGAVSASLGLSPGFLSGTLVVADGECCAVGLADFVSAHVSKTEKFTIASAL